jgi:Kef-type K+ transport system membrane component KefB
MASYGTTCWSAPDRRWARFASYLGHYQLLVVTPALILVLICYCGVVRYGDTSTTANASSLRAPENILFQTLFALSAIILAGRLCSYCCAYVHQPPVIGELIAGIALGPSLLGAIWPQATTFFFPEPVLPTLGVIGQLGIILYMFLIGLELDVGRLRKHGHAAVLISHTSILVPFMSGTLLAMFLYPVYREGEVSFLAFALFLGLAMAVTAFPVLARILRDRNMHETDLGATALACAAADDVAAWCLLAVVLSLAGASFLGGLQVLVLSALYGATMFCIVRPLMATILNRTNVTSRPATALVILIIGLLLSALATEWIGIHALFGAFAFGVTVPRTHALVLLAKERLEGIVSILLMPAFFAYTGMRTEIGLIEGAQAWLLCLLLLIVATAGKFLGTLIPARSLGFSWHKSIALGILMNTRGLMEVVILNIGLDCGFISPRLYSMLVIVAVVTTLATNPALDILETFRVRRSSRSRTGKEPGESTLAETELAKSHHSQHVHAGCVP